MTTKTSKNSDPLKSQLLMKQEALRYHEGDMTPAGAGLSRAGKIEVSSSKSVITQRELSMAYSPGVAEPCLAIQADPEAAYKYTAKGNLVGVITNGTAVLGLGDIGALASKPVMEGKAVLFKKFADIDCFDIEVNASSVDVFVETVAALEPTFGGINLEDIKAPECFEIEERLKKRMNIPVFHDDQHGTAIISGAALMNAAELSGKKLSELRVVFCGGGAASISCARFWLSLGVNLENCVMTDRHGVIYKGRQEEMNPSKDFFAVQDGKTWHGKAVRSLAEAVVGADVFMGCSVGAILTSEMLMTLNKDCIVFAMANPEPEISFEEASGTRSDMIFATGRSDYPNQVNNVLGFPFIFRGALDIRATEINEAMKVAAARALAKLAKESVPESVQRAYGITEKPLQFSAEYIIPKPFDPRVLLYVAPAVAKAAIDSGVASRDYPGASIVAYRARLEKLLGKTQSVMRSLRDRIESSHESSPLRSPGQRPRIVFAEGTNDKILQAASQISLEGFAEPVLLGNPRDVKAAIARLGLDGLDDVELIRPSKSEHYAVFCDTFWKLRQRKGITPDLAAQVMKDPFYFAPMYMREGYADVALAGLTRTYAETIRPALQVVGAQKGKRVAGIYMLVWKQRVLFIADTTVNIQPSALELAEIAASASSVASSLGYASRVAMLSFTSFGASSDPESLKVREAVRLVRERHPEILVDGEIQADLAVSPEILAETFPFSSLQPEGANILICPNLASANIAYKLLGKVGGAELVGPILVGMKKPAHVLQITADVREIVNMAIIAILDAQRLNADAHVSDS